MPWQALLFYVICKKIALVKKAFILFIVLRGLFLSAQVPPTAVIVLGTPTVCAGQSFSCAGYPGGTTTIQNWTVVGATVMGSNSTIYLTYPSPGLYTISLSVITPAGASTNVATQTVLVNPNPTIQAVSSPSLLGQGYTSTLTASGANTYTWQPVLFGGVAYPATVSPSLQVTSNASLGTFVFTVATTNSLGCVGTATTSLKVVPIISIEEEVSKFPEYTHSGSIVKEAFMLKYSLPCHTQYQLFDAQLKLIEKGAFEEVLNLNSESLSSGMYYFLMSNKTGYRLIKLFKVTD